MLARGPRGREVGDRLGMFMLEKTLTGGHVRWSDSDSHTHAMKDLARHSREHTRPRPGGRLGQQ